MECTFLFKSEMFAYVFEFVGGCRRQFKAGCQFDLVAGRFIHDSDNRNYRSQSKNSGNSKIVHKLVHCLVSLHTKFFSYTIKQIAMRDFNIVEHFEVTNELPAVQ